MKENVGDFLKGLFDKGKAQVSVHMRKSVVEKASNELNQLANRHYSSLYLGKIIRAPMVNVIEILQNYVEYNMQGWRQLSQNVAANGSSASFRYALEFTEAFPLGAYGCPLRPLTMLARMKVRFLHQASKTESVSVPYRLLFTVHVLQADGDVGVSATLQELIDPQNGVLYLRSGDFEAPSLLQVRGAGVTSEGLLQYLHANCDESRPSLQEWFDQGGKRLSDVGAARQKLRQAQQDLALADGKLKQLR